MLIDGSEAGGVEARGQLPARRAYSPEGGRMPEARTEPTGSGFAVCGHALLGGRSNGVSPLLVKFRAEGIRGNRSDGVRPFLVADSVREDGSR